ncbi:alpha-amylase family glycosyl hydrolase [Actinotalea fermentans]|uniref:Alpha-amylase n=1 Tax=Actinotalea fermentans TaxID=43671 RepID=A0A511YTH4_9CELL|nr:alpha-amylase family glycosyl hydrolase [Actinotalea fermentans]GEN78493.1 alpha-amylase [Actinotalea fermentans]
MPRTSDRTWWHVYPLGFTDAPATRVGGPHEPRLRRLLPWLDHARDLGATGLLLGPVFDSATHGYDTLDHLRVDPRLGTDADLDALLAAAHDRDLQVALDGVLNHVSDQHPIVVRAREAGFAGPDAAWLRLEHTPDGPRPRVFEGHSSLVELDHANPEVAAYVAGVMNHWLDRGVDAWRLDAAYAVAPELWAPILADVRARHPHAWVFGEVIHGDYADVVDRSGMDSVTQYELWKATWSSIADRNFFELDWTLTRHNGFLETFVPQTFVGNHDVTRIATTLGSQGAVVALAVLMTVGGVPSVYYGDEMGWTGVKEHRAGGDDAVRPPYPAAPAALTGDERVRQAHRDLLALRRARPWLTTATTRTLELTNTRYRYRAEAADGGAALEVELDVSGTPRATVRADDGALLWESVA